MNEIELEVSGSAEEERKEKTFLDKFVPDVEKMFKKDADEKLLTMLENTEKFDEDTEMMFTYLQVATACFDAFAHGANDVANAVGPLAAVISIYSTGVIEDDTNVPPWVLAIGGVGIIAGLATYGYNIIQAIGFELTKLTPSRGFSIELGAALVVITGSRLKIPLSTTHCQVGATVGVGLAQGCGNINWWLMVKVAGGWVMTLVVSALFTSLIFSYAVFAPHV